MVLLMVQSQLLTVMQDTLADTIKTVTLANHGNATITSTILDTLNITGGGAAGTIAGTITLNQSAADTSTAATTLNITGSGHTGAIDGTQADVYTTVNINATSNMTIADVNFMLLRYKCFWSWCYSYISLN